MNMVIFYFSGTGNTWWAASRLQKELESLGNAVEMYSLENPEMRDTGFAAGKIAAADRVIIGYPVYGSDLPENMKTFVANLPEVTDGKGFSAFCTQAKFSGDANVFFKPEMEAKGYKFRQSFQLDITTNFNVAMFPFSFSRPARGKKLEKIKAKAAAKIKKMAGFIAEDREYFEGYRFYQQLLGKLQRSMFRKNEKKLPDKFQFLPGRCKKCGRCASECPAANLDFESGDPPKLTWGDHCMLCFRCYNFCPGLAINFGGKVTNPEKYRRFKGPVENLKIADIRK